MPDPAGEILQKDWWETLANAVALGRVPLIPVLASWMWGLSRCEEQCIKAVHLVEAMELSNHRASSDGLSRGFRIQIGSRSQTFLLLPKA